MEMTQKWINDFNKKCAEFLDWKFEEDDLIFSFDKKNSFEFLNRPAYAIYDLKFHSDWNWIMEVFKKVQEMGYMYGIVKGASSIWNGTDTTPIFIKSSSDPLEASILVIDQFIDWYNKQKES